MSYNSMEKYLVIGANGLIGSKLTRLLTQKNLIWFGTYNKRSKKDLIRLDIGNSQELGKVFEQIDPDIVFHCANLGGGVDFCEYNRDLCRNFHLAATQSIGNFCKLVGARFVYVSTDYVFNDRLEPAREEDIPQPLNFYGKMKLAAEQWITDNLSDFTIIRTTNVYGWDPQTTTPNFIMNLFRTINNNESFKAPAYLWGTPTYVGDLVQFMYELVNMYPSDVYHVVGSEFINRYNWAVRACDILEMDSSRVIKISMPPDNMIPRPMKLVLSTSKVNNLLKSNLHNVTDGLQLMKEDMINERQV